MALGNRLLPSARMWEPYVVISLETGYTGVIRYAT